MDSMLVPPSVTTPATANPQATPQHLFTKNSADTITTKEGKTVTLKKGSLASETVSTFNKISNNFH